MPYEHPAPGDLLHLDVKRLGRIPDGGRQRVHGRASTTPRVRGAGHDFLHVASTTTAATLTSRHSRRARSELCRLPRARPHRAQPRGADVRAVLTDNARAYDSRAFRAVADPHAVSLERTQPYRPQTNGKAERFIRIPQDEWPYARSYRSNADRPRELPRWLYRYHYRRPHGGINGAVPTSRL